MKQIYLDTSIFIYYFEKHPEFGPLSKPIFEKLFKNKIEASTNIITLTEVLSAPYLEDKDAQKISTIFYSLPNLTVYEVNREIALKAATLRRKYHLKLGDAIQLATAIISKAKEFITNDIGLKKFNEVKVILLKEL